MQTKNQASAISSGGVYRKATHKSLFPSDRFTGKGTGFSDDLLHSARERAEHIARHLISKRGSLNALGLYNGDSGTALYFATCYLLTKDERFICKMNRTIDRLSQIIESGRNSLASLCGGLAGYGWMLCYLKQHELIELHEEYLCTLDGVLDEHMRLSCNDGIFDQMHNAVSIAWYFLKRNDRAKISELIGWLDSAKIDTYGEAKWLSYDYNARLMKFDCGLAHGMAGLMLFFSKCYKQGIMPEKCRELAEGIFAFYRHNEQDMQTNGSLYPLHVPAENYAPGKITSYSRLAWCYGDAGVLCAMYMCGLYIGSSEICDYAVGRLELTASRRSESSTLSVEAMFCHGSASLAYMYNKVYRLSGRPALLEAAGYWYDVTVRLGGDPDSKSGYRFVYQYEPEAKCEIDSLLNGTAGIGLALLAALGERHTDWDECLMLG